mgnify:CR=1 FL=1
MNPPNWIDRLLEWFCDPSLLEDIQGDLHEIYHENISKKGKKMSDLIYFWWVIRSFRLATIKKGKVKLPFIMSTTQNIKVALRVLRRDTFNTTLNTLGLTLGIICFVLLGLYVYQEVTYDEFHSKKDRIYRTYLYEDYGNDQIFFNSTTPFLFEELFEDHFPEIEAAVQYTLRNFGVGRNEPSINESIAIISPEFFSVFDFEIIRGNETDPIPTRNDIIISEKYADKYFPDEYPVGKKINLLINQEKKEFTVTAVMKDIPKTSSIQFDLAISNKNNLMIFGERALAGWFTIAPETYVLLKKDVTVNRVEEKTQDVIMSHLGERVKKDEYTIGFQPLTDIHLNPEIPVGNAPVSNPKYVYLLGTIGLLVLIIACINYSTISIGQSLKRGKDVGMRKVLGAKKNTLIYQYISESILISIVAMLIGSILAILIIPYFNRLAGTDIVYNFHWWHLLIFLFIAFSIGIVAGIYPVFILSNVKAISILQSSLQLKSNHIIRKGMVIFQFLITVFLITSAIIMQRQLNYLQDKELGYRHEAIISVPLYAKERSDRLLERYYNTYEDGQILKTSLLNHPEISRVTLGSHSFGTSGWANLAFTDKNGIFRRFRLLGTDPEFLDFFNIRIIEGRGFEEGNGLDERQSIILNEAAVEYFGLENPVGDQLPGEEFGEHRIIGVTENFHFTTLHHKIEPLVIAQNIVPIFRGISDGDIVDPITPKLFFSYSGAQLLRAESILQEEWDQVFPSFNLEFEFIDDKLARQYETEARMKQLVTISTILSIIIASIGLLGLTVLIANSREKEIGIRKVLGASPGQIFLRLVRIFAIQLLIGIVLSVPITVFLMRDWLEDFAYRIDISIDMFFLSAIISTVIALLVVSYHALRAAKINPVKSLRTE